MYCKNCGQQMGDFDTVCRNCGMSNMVKDTGNFSVNSKPVKTTGLLVWSIIEILSCVSFLPGLIALIVWIVKLDPNAKKGNLTEVKNAKTILKIILWIGIIIPVLILLFVGFMFILIPNTAGIASNQQIKVDLVNGRNIGMVLREWYVDEKVNAKYQWDPAYKKLERDWMRVDELRDIEKYLQIDTMPRTYMNEKGEDFESGAYYATVINEENPSDAKIVVAIGPKDLANPPVKDNNFLEVFLDEPTENDKVEYTGKGSGIVYIEQ